MNLTKNLAGKISIGYITIAIVSLLASVLSLVILSSNKDIDNEISEYSVPSLFLYKDLNGLNLELKRLCNSWIYTPNQADKQNLQKVLKEDWPALDVRIAEIADKSSEEQNRLEFKKVRESFNKLALNAKAISESLSNDDDYADDSKVDVALTVYDKSLMPVYLENDKLLRNALTKYGKNLKELQQKKDDSYRLFTSVLVMMLLAILITGYISLTVSRRIIIAPINNLKEIINRVGQGEITEVNEADTQDEIGEMRKSIKGLINGFKSNTDFAIAIGKGNYDVEFKALSQKDNLGNALLEMRKNLKITTEDEKRRSWATVGIANMGEILRKNDVTELELYDNIISNLVKYLGANQGCLFILEHDTVTNKEYLELKSCYAYSRKKYINKRIEIGEGLVGQCFLEREVIYLTEVPNGYMEITSGLGDSTPNVVLLVPIKLNESIFGIIEIASFDKLETYQIEFIEKNAEGIGSVVANAKINNRTKMLLQEFQEQSEMLRSQEEEMRQNMEELSATQEEMARKELEYIEIIKNLREAQIEKG